MYIKRYKIALIIFSFIFALSVVAFFATANFFNAEATNQNSYLYMPRTVTEYYRLKSPVDVSYSNDSYAFLENTGSELNIVVFKDGAYTLYKGEDFTTPLADNMQIKTVSHFAVTQQTARPYALNTETGEYFKISDDITCKHFDFNGKYFVALDNSKAYIYKMAVDDGIDLESTGLSIEVSSSINIIAINSNDDIFYFNTSGYLCRRNIASIINAPTLSVNIGTPNYLIADNDYLYYSSDNGVGRVSLSDGTVSTLLQSTPSSDYTGLGQITLPKGMCFKDENLLICDGIKNTVQEFSIESNAISFTGFAVATTEDYKDRLAYGAKDVYVSGNNVYVLEEHAVKVLNKKLSECKSYDLTDYTAAFTPKAIASDGKTVCAMGQTGVLIINLSTGSVTDLHSSIDNCCCSVTYADGYYYVLSYDISVEHHGRIFKIKPNAQTYANKDYVDLDITAIDSTSHFTADVDGLFYVYTESDKTVTKLNTDGTAFENNGTPVKYNLTLSSLKIAADISGNVFSLAAGNTVEKVIDDTYNGTFILDVPSEFTTERFNAVNAISFSLSYDRKETFFIFDNEGFVITTEELENLSTENVPVPVDFTINGSELDLNAVKTVYVPENVNLYAVKYDSSSEMFVYLDTVKSTGVTYVTAAESSGFYVALGNTMYLVRKTNCLLNENAVTDITPKTVYAATNVGLYYLPVLADNYDYTLKNGNVSVKVEKECKLTVKCSVQIDGYLFYLADYVTAAATYTGFVPESFVTENLAELKVNGNQVTYKTGKVNASDTRSVNIYSDADKSAVILTLTSNVDVNVYSEENGMSLISCSVNGLTYNGYIENSAIANEGRVAVKRALIFLLIALSVCGTSVFLIMRKNRDEK